jgi:translocation protein SEC72
MEDPETFTQLPLHLDPQSKALSTSSSSRALQEELTLLNTLHRQLLTLETPSPPPPVPVNPKRSAQITKLRESGNADFRKSLFPSAIKLYTLAIQMALTRPPWEPVGLVREEIAGLYANRSQAHMALGSWVEGWVDAELSVESKRSGNVKGWWRGGRCLLEMGRLEEAAAWVKEGLEVEGGERELVELGVEVEKKIAGGKE